MFQRNKRSKSGIVILQVDDSVSVGTKRFLQNVDKTSAEFLSKPKRRIAGDKNIFRGV